MLFAYLKLGFTISDRDFDKIYPESIQNLSKENQTPLEVCIRAARLLVKDSNTKVLDIGSGAGKFCLIGASVTGARFTGIEQQKELVEISKSIASAYSIYNLTILNSNISSINFSDYDSFYLFNPQYENRVESLNVGSPIQPAPNPNKEYTQYIKKQLEQMPAGTKIVTYQGEANEIPLCYALVSSDFNASLKCWVKKKDMADKEIIFQKQLIQHSVSRLKILGFENVNEHNIMQDEVYKTIFEKILKSRLGQMEFTDQAIASLLEKLKNT